MKFTSSLKELGYLFIIFMILIFLFNPIIAQDDSLNIRTVAVYPWWMVPALYQFTNCVEIDSDNPNIMYLASSSGLGIADISDPLDIKILSILGFGPINDFTYKDGVIYCIGYKLFSIDVSDPYSPEILDSLDIYASRIVYQKDHLFIGRTRPYGFCIVNVENPESLEKVYHDSTIEIWTIDCEDTILVVAYHGYGDTIFYKSIIARYNVTDVTSPELIDTFVIVHDTIINQQAGIIIEDGIIYHCSGHYLHGINIIDTKDSMELLSSLNKNYGWDAQMIKYGNLLFITPSYSTRGVFVIDLNDLRIPKEIAYYKKRSSVGGRKEGAIKDTLFYFAGYHDFRVFDFSAISRIEENTYRHRKENNIIFNVNQSFQSLTIQTQGQIIDGLKLYDISGKEVLDLNLFTNSNVTINLSNYLSNSGMYFMIIKSGNNLVLGKLLFLK